MIGTDLIPLNSMDKKSELYSRHAKKYIGRENLMDVTIPKLNCKWNDVVQFSALNPQVVLEDLKKYIEELKLDRSEFFKVHIQQIIDKYDVVMLNRIHEREFGDFSISEDEVEFMTLKNYTELVETPLETKRFWEYAKAHQKPLLWFPGITHILVKGIIETTQFEICELRG